MLSCQRHFPGGINQPVLVLDECAKQIDLKNQLKSTTIIKCETTIPRGKTRETIDERKVMLLLLAGEKSHRYNGWYIDMNSWGTWIC